MDVVGIDPSLTCTGLAYTFAQSSSIQLHRITTEPAEGLSELRARIRYIVGRVLVLTPERCLTVIERPLIPRHKAGAVLERAWLFGMLVDQMMTRGPVVQVQQGVRAIYACGNGHGSKDDVLAAVQATFPQLRVPDDNVADALALLGIGARHLGEPIDGDLPKKQTRALASINWKDLA